MLQKKTNIYHFTQNIINLIIETLFEKDTYNV